jgi:hypothetical protein
MTEREFKAWRRWLLGEHEKCPLCGRPMPGLKGVNYDADRDSQGRRHSDRAVRRPLPRGSQP